MGKFRPCSGPLENRDRQATGAASAEEALLRLLETQERRLSIPNDAKGEADAD
jgi:hypothetical protein